MPAPIALVDYKNFYASCERVFQPELRGKPVVVLFNKGLTQHRCYQPQSKVGHLRLDALKQELA